MGNIFLLDLFVSTVIENLMRMWNVDPSKMCRKHLLGEHVEMHMFVGTILKGTSIQGYINSGLVEVPNIIWRHHALVGEMLQRGYKHKKDLPTFPSKSVERYWSNLGKVDVAANEIELHRRCKECKFEGKV